MSRKVVFKRLEPEALEVIRERHDEEEARLMVEKAEALRIELADKENKENKSRAKLKKEKKQREIDAEANKRKPNPEFEAGKNLPLRCSDHFPVKKLAGTPLEELDDFYKTDYVSLNLIF